METKTRRIIRAIFAFVSVSAILVDCSSSLPSAKDASVVQDADGDVWCELSFSQSFGCDGGPALIPGPCPDAPRSIIHSDAGWAVGCSIDQNDHRYFDPDAGACGTPVYTCVATPTPHWELSFDSVGIP